MTSLRLPELDSIFILLAAIDEIDASIRLPRSQVAHLIVYRILSAFADAFRNPSLDQIGPGLWNREQGLRILSGH